MQTLQIHKVYKAPRLDPQQTRTAKASAGSKEWKLPWASPDLNSIKALQGDQRERLGDRQNEEGGGQFQIPNIVSNKTGDRDSEEPKREDTRTPTLPYTEAIGLVRLLSLQANVTLMSPC